LPLFEAGKVRGSVLEFAGSGLAALDVDERATLTNMAVEAGAFTGIMEADDAVLDYLVRERGFSRENLMKRRVQADPDAFYAHSVCLDLAIVEPMVALPGDPRNAIPLRELSARHGGKVSIDIAYAGSCTGGKRADMDMYAAVLGRAVREGRGVAPGVRLFIQFGSLRIRRYAEQAGYVELFERAGAVLVEPSCGACIRAGPGVSERAEQVTVSSINRNYPGRSGPGLVYLANPWVVAASAVEGCIAAPEFD
jgi:3-isopropylmalate/(R)-2-methylmalate dehydratase large subunit